MTLLEKYCLIAFNTADAVVETPQADPSALAPVVDAPVDGAPDTVEPPAAVVPPPKEEKMVPLSVMLERLGRETARVSAAERRALDAEEMARRLQTARPAQDDPAPAPVVPAADRQAEIRAEADKLRFYEDTVDVRNRGLAQFGGAFTEALDVLSKLGATSNEFISDVLAIDKPNAHVLLEKIAKDPERAIALAEMTSRQRIAELARMTVTASPASAVVEPKTPAVAPKTVSKAPPPAPPVQPSASKVVDGYSDEATDAQFDAQFNERWEKRQARR
jgi:hypothetical protein